MKSTILILLAALLVASGVWFFHETGKLLVSRDYVASAIHIVAGIATLRAGVQLARLAVVLHLRS